MFSTHYHSLVDELSHDPRVTLGHMVSNRIIEYILIEIRRQTSIVLVVSIIIVIVYCTLLLYQIY